MAAALRRDIHQLRCQNIDSRSFVPDVALERCATYDKILEAVKDCGLEAFQIYETASAVFAGSRKVFAVLLLIHHEGLIQRFICNDQFRPKELDSKLPFSLSTLKDIIPTAASQFYEKQWEFTAPIFTKYTTHRILDKDIILPFVGSEKLAEGGFGRVYRTIIHSDHCNFAATSTRCVSFQNSTKDIQVLIWIERESLKIVRKELKENGEHQITDEEHRVLSYLNCLQHPNIVELIGSYTYKGVQNMLFPLLGVSLESVFTGVQAKQTLDQDYWLAALCGLSSAIETVHKCSSDTLGFHLIGCHHDLKPNNILVHDGKFVLADFGLSSLKRQSQTSKSDFKMGASYYQAPECEDSDHEFGRRTVSRPSDIWSFGCIIAELLTFMLRGSEGLKSFKMKRKVKLGGWYNTYVFHGGNNPNPRVDEWLTELLSGPGHVYQDLIILIRRMLSMDPFFRPKASQVTFELCRQAAQAAASLVDLSWGAHGGLLQDIEISVERERFRSLMWAMGLLQDTGHNAKHTGGDYSWINSCFEQTIQALRDLQRELKSIPTLVVVGRVYSFKLRMFNDSISKNLPQELLNRAATQLELAMMSSNDPGVLRQVSAMLPDNGTYESLRALASIKELHNSYSTAPEFGASPPLLSLDFIHTSISRPVYDLAWVKKSPSEEQRLVFIEWVVYDYRWSQPSKGKDMLDRMRARAHMLSSIDVQSRLRTLRCTGYFQEESQHRFGFIFDYPTLHGKSLVENESEPTDAHMIIEKHGDEWLHSLNGMIQSNSDKVLRPCLEDKFELAATLASSLLEFHKVGWLNKNLCSHNIVFAKSKVTLEETYNIRFPYFIGLNHSRPGDPDDHNSPEFSEGPHSRNLNGYCHPEYVLGAPRYRFQYDYFSLGIILLEIGLWKVQIEMGGFSLPKEPPSISNELSNTKERVKYLLHDWVPRLTYSMGTRYCNVVKACLEGNFETSGSHAILLSFNKKVVSQLRKCVI